jgi:hypothetical protein
LKFSALLYIFSFAKPKTEFTIHYKVEIENMCVAKSEGVTPKYIRDIEFHVNKSYNRMGVAS